MSYKESEFPDLIEKVFKLADEWGDRSFTSEVLKEVIALNKQIPLYPGIVAMCLANLLKPVKGEELKKGDRVFIKLKDGYAFGEFEGFDDGKIKLKNVSLSKKLSEGVFEADGAKEIKKLRKDILKKIWPTLVFEEKK